MLLKSLEEKLKSDHLLLDSQIVKDRQVYDLIPVTEATEYRDDVLYISDNLKAMDKSQMPANLLWCGARLTEEDALRINWIRTEPEKLAETIACARQYILDNHAIQNLRFHIMESLLHGTGLGTILNEIGNLNRHYGYERQDHSQLPALPYRGLSVAGERSPRLLSAFFH